MKIKKVPGLIISLTLNSFFLYILSAQPKNVTILHTNDIHAGFLPHKAFWVVPEKGEKPLIGGLNELSYKVDSLRFVKKNTLLLDAGDVMTGNPITEYDYNGAKGGAIFEMMNYIGYDAWTPGNHDFDVSQKNFFNLTKVSRFSTLNANIADTSGMLILKKSAYALFEKNGMRFGIIGLMSKDFPGLVSKRSGKGIIILPPAVELQKWIDTLRPYSDIIIALTHEGLEDDSVLAGEVKGLDIIIGGHSHTRLWKPRIVNNVIIVQTGSGCENLGILDLTVENGRVIGYNSELLPLWYNSSRGETPLSEFIDSVKKKIDYDYSEVICTLKTDWKRGRGESGIGNFITDAQREAAGTDVAFMNSHGIRKDMPAGPLTKMDLFEILPFADRLVKFNLTGAQIRSIIEYYIKQRPPINISGISCKWKKLKKGGIKLISVLVNGDELDDNRIYTGTASDYLAGEAEKYTGIKIPDVTVLDQSVNSSVERKMRMDKTVSSAAECRIEKIK